MKVLILSSLAYSLTNFRGALLEELVRRGHDVIAGAPDNDAEVEQKLQSIGVQFRCTPMARTGTNPFEDIVTLLRYVRLMFRERPDVVLAYTQKPIIYGGLAARIYGRANYYALMTGLGYVFSPEASGRTMFRKIVSLIYREGVKKAKAIFVFNGDDRKDMMDAGIIKADANTIQVPGSGVDTDHYTQQPLPDGPLTFLMVGRLMRDKGVYEFVEAARQIKEQYPDCRFRILGRLEENNPTGISPAECRNWSEQGTVELLPETRDVRPYLAESHVFVLPSFYREGLPRTILEAISTGRAVVTTDLPGCREPIEAGQNGILVPPRDSDALAKAMREFIDRPELIKTMAKRSREIAVSCYDVRLVNKILIGHMGLDHPSAGKAQIFSAVHHEKPNAPNSLSHASSKL